MAWVDINNSEIAVGKPIKQTLFQRIKDNLDYLYTYNNQNNVTNSGTSTDNAIARFDGTTGKIIQNSSVIIDDSGNISGAGTYNTYTINQSVGSSSSPTFVGLTLTAFSGVLKASTGIISASAIVNADIDANAAIVDTKLATISTAGKVSNSATTATSANTASAIVARDANGDFSANAVTLASYLKFDNDLEEKIVLYGTAGANSNSSIGTSSNEIYHKVDATTTKFAWKEWNGSSLVTRMELKPGTFGLHQLDMKSSASGVKAGYFSFHGTSAATPNASYWSFGDMILDKDAGSDGTLVIAGQENGTTAHANSGFKFTRGSAADGSENQFSCSRIRVSDGSVSAPSYAFTNSTNTGLYYGSSVLKATLAGDEKLAISANQRNYFGRSKTLTDNAINSILDINVASNSSATVIVSASLTCVVGNVVKHASIDIICIVKNENGTISTNIRSTETQYSAPDIIITPTLVAGTAKATLNIFADSTNNSTIDMHYECKYLGVTTNTITFL